MKRRALLKNLAFGIIGLCLPGKVLFDGPKLLSAPDGVVGMEFAKAEKFIAIPDFDTGELLRTNVTVREFATMVFEQGLKAFVDFVEKR